MSKESKKKPRVLLVNPPIYDFTAYDFWLKPYGLLRVAGQLRDRAELELFDYVDRLHPAAEGTLKEDRWGRGQFLSTQIPKPAVLAAIPRRYHRFGLPRSHLLKLLESKGPFDVVLIQTVMTYWYLGVLEVIEDLRRHSPRSRIVLGGNYATLCPDHAGGLGADLVIRGNDLHPLGELLSIDLAPGELPFWEGYPRLATGVLRLTEGCPFRCTYCSVPQVQPSFNGRLSAALSEFHQLRLLGVRRLAFYDDALLFRERNLLLPFLEEGEASGADIELHTPNALNARFITKEVASRMVTAGFGSFYLGFESSSYEWQRQTGSKVYSDELASAVEQLLRAGARADQISAYLIIAHRAADHQQAEESMLFARDLGIRVMLSEFSPIPGTPDGEICRRWVDLDEPLWHNKTVFPLMFLGAKEGTRLKGFSRELNRTLSPAA